MDIRAPYVSCSLVGWVSLLPLYDVCCYMLFLFIAFILYTALLVPTFFLCKYFPMFQKFFKF